MSGLPLIHLSDGPLAAAGRRSRDRAGIASPAETTQDLRTHVGGGLYVKPLGHISPDEREDAVSLVGFKGQNHPQQTKRRGAKPEVDNLATTAEVFDPLHERFGFTIDVAALPHNAKCERYFTPTVDGLKQPWAKERVWCNPPYSNLEPWVEKAHHEWRWMSLAERRQSVIVMLVPANRCEQGWWQRQVEPFRDRGKDFRVQFIAGRLRFIKHGHDRVEPNQRPPFGCALLIWGGA